VWTDTRLAVQPASASHHDPESQPTRLLGKPEVPVVNSRLVQQPHDQIVARRVELILPPDRNVELRQQLGFPTLCDSRIDPEH
jgi:hypothetical protein